MRSSTIPAVFALAVALLATAQLPRAHADEPPVRGDAPAKVVVVDVQNVKPVEGRDIANAVLVFDKPVPNGKRTLVVDLADGRRARLNLLPVEQDPGGKKLKLGQPTKRLLVQWAPKKDNLRPDQLKGRPARFVSQDGPPE